MDNNINLDWVQPDWDTSSTTCNLVEWSCPKLIETKEVGESIEMVYKQYRLYHYTTININSTSEEKVFKIIYSCKDGKWHKSERIYGKIIPAQEEGYEFTD